MTPKARVIAAFEKRPTDKVPTYQAGFASKAGSYVLGREAYVGGGMQQWRESKALWEGPDAHAEYLVRSKQDAYDIVKTLDLDVVRPAYWRMAEKPTKKIDEHTYRYGDPETVWRVMRLDPETELYQIIDQSPKPELTMADIERTVEAEEAGLDGYHPSADGYGVYREALEEFGDERAVPGGGVGVNINYKERVWLEALALRPDLVGRHFMVQAERGCRNADAQAQLGLRILFGGGDFCAQSGPFYSPKLFHELTTPALKKVTDGCAKNGQFHCFATDGNVWPVADDLFGTAGVHCFYEIDARAGMDLRKLRERFPHLTCLGSICSYTLHLGTKDDVIRETMYCLEAAKDYGGIVVGCSNQIISKTPPENLWAMIDTIRENR